MESDDVTDYIGGISVRAGEIAIGDWFQRAIKIFALC